MDIRALDDDLGRRCGLLLGVTPESDVIHAAVVLLAGDEIFTSNPADLQELAAAAGTHVELIPV